jgi:hypothetical protein
MYKAASYRCPLIHFESTASGADLMRLFALLLLLGGLSRAADEAGLRAALDAHRWFDLRDAVTSRRAPPFYRLLVAAAFNDVRAAEKELSAVIRSGAGQEQLADVHYALYRMYYRSGHYRKAITEMRQIASLAPGRTPSKAEIADAEALGQLPDPEIVSRRSAIVKAANWESAIVVAPLTINGGDAHFAIDTGAGISVMTEAEAKRLGMRIMAGQPLVTGAMGKPTQNGHYAVADRLKIGNTEVLNAAFLVLPDGLEVFSTIPLGQQGILGLPILLALQTIRWTRSHELSIGFPAGRANLRAANLSFEDLYPLTTIEIEGRRLAVDLDTGGKSSSMWPLFVKEFPALLQDARKGTTKWVGADGAVTMDAMIVPELRMKLAGFPIVLRDAPALLSTTVSASNLHYGWICMDLLNKAAEVTLDFRAMRIQLK